MNITTTAVAALAAARLTRLVTTDALGERYVQEPADALLASKFTRVSDTRDPLTGRMVKHTDVDERAEFLRDGLYCPFCVGFWLGAGVLATAPVWTRHRLPRLAVQALALNYVVGHVNARVDD